MLLACISGMDYDLWVLGECGAPLNAPARRKSRADLVKYETPTSTFRRVSSGAYMGIGLTWGEGQFLHCPLDAIMHAGEVRRIGRSWLNRNNNETGKDEDHRRKYPAGPRGHCPQGARNALADAPKRYRLEGVLRHFQTVVWYVLSLFALILRPQRMNASFPKTIRAAHQKAAADAQAKSATGTGRKRACERRKRYRLHNIAISDQSSKHKSEGFASYSPWARRPRHFNGPCQRRGQAPQHAGAGQ